MSEPAVWRCPCCFAELARKESCPRCGCAAAAQNPSDCLPVGTLLDKSFRVGAAVAHEAESQLYRGFDLARSCTVYIAELFPTPLVRREGETVLPRAGGEVIFKSLTEDFLELAQPRIDGLEEMRLVCALARFTQNGTAYAVFPDGGYTTLESFLQADNAPWSLARVRRELLPILSTVQALHAGGILHRGVSAKTILRDGDGRLWLWRLATAAGRTGGSEIDSTLLAPYAAPEQYSPGGWQGSWTDVYSLCAVIYRLMMGECHSAATNAQRLDTITARLGSAADAPKAMIAALEKGLRRNVPSRIASVEELIQALTQEGGATAVYETEAMLDAQPAAARAPKSARQGRQARPANTRLALGLLALAGALGLLVFFLYPSGQGEPPAPPVPPPESSGSVPTVVVTPDFTGLYVETLRRDAAAMEKWNIRIVEEYSEQHPSGIVGRQSPPQGTQFPEGGRLILYVSKGTQNALMPAVIGLSSEDAGRLLSSMAIKYRIVLSSDPAYRVNVVEHTSIAAGNTVRRLTDTVELYVGQETAAEVEVPPPTPHYFPRSSSSGELIVYPNLDSN